MNNKIQIRARILSVALLLTFAGTLLLAEADQAQGESTYIYVAPNVIQSRAAAIFTTFALTNTSEYWFNPRIYLIDPDGEIVARFNPLLKGFGTLQKTTGDFLLEDFQGSVWIVSPQPIVASAFIHQSKLDHSLALLGTAGLEKMEAQAAVAALKMLVEREQ